jgi:2-keto-4-pentenoate hydratase
LGCDELSRLGRRYAGAQGHRESDNGAMNDIDFDAARAELASARRDARAITQWPAARLPRDLAEAYRLQAAVTRDLGAIGGWKVAAVTPAQRESLGVPVPIAGPLLRPWMRDARAAPPTLSAASFIAPKLECEFAFELARDLPPRPARAYSRDEVRATTQALRIAVEIVDSRLPRGLGALAELGDAFNNGAFVAGPAITGWHDLDFAHIEIFLTRSHDGASEEVARGSGKAILDGDPFGTVVLLANAPADAARGLVAGDIVTTGSCTGAPFLPGPGTYRAEFATLGSVELRFIA